MSEILWKMLRVFELYICFSRLHHSPVTSACSHLQVKTLWRAGTKFCSCDNSVVFFLDFNCWTQNCLSDQGGLHQSRFYRRISAEWDESHFPPHWFYILFLEAQREQRTPLCFQWHSQCCHCFLSVEWERNAWFFLILRHEPWGKRASLGVPLPTCHFSPEADKQFFAIKLKKKKKTKKKNISSFICFVHFVSVHLSSHWSHFSLRPVSLLFSGPFPFKPHAFRKNK